MILIKGKHYFTPPGIFMGYVLLLTGVFIILFPLLKMQDPGWWGGFILAGLILLFIGLVFSTTKEEFILDVSRGKYKKASFFLGIHSGAWQQLPSIGGVIMTPVKISYSIENFISPKLTLTESRYRVMLYVKDAVRGIIVSEFSKAKALKAASLLSESLGVPIEEVLEGR